VKRTTALVRRGDDLEPYATRINHALGKTIEAIFETGRLLLEARDKLEHGKWARLFDERRVPIGLRTANRFIEIYKRREYLASGSNSSRLPPSWTTLYELARLPDDTLTWAHEQNKIRPDLKGKDIARIRAEYDGVELPSPKSAPASISVRTPGSELVTKIERLLHGTLEKLSPDDRDYVVCMLRETLDRLGSKEEVS
jgi:Protein of unknown function (DUF3102)